MRSWLLALSVLLVSSMASAIDYQEGKHYQVLEEPVQQYEAEIVEFYNFACMYCFRAEGGVQYLLERLPADTRLTRIPLVLGKGERFNSAAYVGWIAADLGYMDTYRHYLFQLARAPLPWEIKRYNRLSSMENVKTLFVDLGVSEERYGKALIQATANIETAEALAKKMRITATPAFLVNGKYLVQGLRPIPFAEYRLADLILHLEKLP